MIKKTLFVLITAMSVIRTSAQELHINARTGNDAGNGTLLQPLKTIAEAARRINATYKKESATILLADGVYALTETVLFNNDKFSQENRLTIRAEIMPDDPKWNPQLMPLIMSVASAIVTPGDGFESRGLEIDVSHATVEGIKFTGNPLYYFIDGKQSRRYYPVWREGKNLDDLLISQCLFVGNRDLMPLRVAVIANGDGLVLDHCVFYNCENSVVYWDAEGSTSHRNAMRYCLVYGGNYSGVWTTGNTGDDFDFHHNIIAGSRVAWISDKSTHHYQAYNSIFANNTYLTRFGDEAGISGAGTSSNFLKTNNVKLTGNIEIEKDQSKNNYLQLKEGSFGSELKAGLFKK